MQDRPALCDLPQLQTRRGCSRRQRLDREVWYVSSPFDRDWIRTAGLGFALALLAACAAPTPTATPSPTAQASPQTATASPSPTRTLVLTRTLAPTRTPEPTHTPTPPPTDTPLPSLTPTLGPPVTRTPAPAAQCPESSGQTPTITLSDTIEGFETQILDYLNARGLGSGLEAVLTSLTTTVNDQQAHVKAQVISQDVTGDATPDVVIFPSPAGCLAPAMFLFSNAGPDDMKPVSSSMEVIQPPLITGCHRWDSARCFGWLET